MNANGKEPLIHNDGYVEDNPPPLEEEVPVAEDQKMEPEESQQREAYMEHDPEEHSDEDLEEDPEKYLEEFMREMVEDGPEEDSGVHRKQRWLVSPPKGTGFFFYFLF